MTKQECCPEAEELLRHKPPLRGNIVGQYYWVKDVDEFVAKVEAFLKDSADFKQKIRNILNEMPVDPIKSDNVYLLEWKKRLLSALSKETNK